jgi:hypothetical protein
MRGAALGVLFVTVAALAVTAVWVPLRCETRYVSPGRPNPWVDPTGVLVASYERYEHNWVWTAGTPLGQYEGPEARKADGYTRRAIRWPALGARLGLIAFLGVLLVFRLNRRTESPPNPADSEPASGDGD